MKKFQLFSIAYLLSPVIAAAAPTTAHGLVRLLVAILQSLIPILIGLAVLLFLWGLLRYVISRDDNSRKEAVSVITYGVIVLFVMVSVWGLVNLVARTLGINIQTNSPIPPKYETVESLQI